MVGTPGNKFNLHQFLGVWKGVFPMATTDLFRARLDARFNLSWLLRANARYGLKAVYLYLIWMAAIVAVAVKWADVHHQNSSLRLADAAG
jgi:hypothetical protein